MSICAIIATRNRRADLLACLASLAVQTHPPDEVIVVDASHDLCGDEARSYQRASGSVRLRYEHARTPGAASQRNQALDLLDAATDYVVLLDDDVVLEPDYCAVLVDALESDRNLVGVGGWITNPQAAPFESALGWLLRLFLIYGAEPGQVLPSGFNTPMFVRQPGTRFPSDCLEGGNACFRAEVLRGLRFDHGYERFSGYAYAEDLDLTYAVGRSGRLCVEPRARMLHNVSPAGRVDNLRLGLAQAVNRARFLRKHLGRDVGHLVCYLWAMLGVWLLNIAMIARGRSPLRALGNFAGLAIVLTEWHQPLAEEPWCRN
jgi:GT2 family glycosyltransferase